MRFGQTVNSNISSAMSSLIKVANGQISMNMFYSSKTQNNSAYAKAGLEAFGIDTTRPFSINERQFYFNSEDRIVRVKNKVLKAWTFMGSRVAVNDRSAAERISMEMNVGTSFVTAVDAYKGYYSQSDNNKRKLRACSLACGYYYLTMEAGQNT